VHLVGFIIRIYHDAQSSECLAGLYKRLLGILKIDTKKNSTNNASGPELLSLVTFMVKVMTVT